MSQNIQILILAAGSSSRMGRPKQSLIYQGKTLLESSIEKAMATELKVSVVTGANYAEDLKTLDRFDLNIIHNPNWAQGMGNSLKIGLKQVIDNTTSLDAILIMVCDQPKLTKNILFQIIDRYKQGESQVACLYNDTLGVPALFDKKHFNDLLSIGNTSGAKSVINKNCSKVLFPEGQIDVDTPEDYKNLAK